MPPAIAIRGLTKRFGTLAAVDSLSLEIGEGEVFGLLGPNGAGKTTTLLMLTTLIPPTGGSATVGGYDIVAEPDRVRSSIGIVFQDPSSDETLTGYENLKLHGLLYGMPAELREQRIAEVLALVELTDRKDEMVKRYSGGMRRRLELARGLMHHPKILFLDEPTLGLDPQTREHIWEYIRRLAQEKKITIILTTHYMDEAERLCDRVGIMDHGRIIALGTPQQLIASVGGDHIVEFATAGDRAIDSALLTKIPGVRSHRIDASVHQLSVVDLHTTVPRVFAAMDSAGLELAEFRTHSATLEDVFVSLTGRNLRDE